MKSKMTRMLEHLQKHPRQKYGQLQTTLYNLGRKKSEQVAKAPTGWSCNNIRVIIDRGVIEQDENGLWFLTDHGKKKINKPYAYTVEDELRHMTKMFEKSREQVSVLVAENNKLREFKNKFRSLVDLSFEEDLWN